MRTLAPLPMILVGLLLAGWPASVQAQDTTPPLLTAVQVGVELHRNGDPLDVSVSAAADEPALFEVTCTYASSYLRFGDAALDYWQYKTAAVGDHTRISLLPATSIDDFPLVVGPRCYHADTLTVAVVAVDTAGNRSAPAVAYQAAVDMPFPAPGPIPGGDTYAVSTHWNGSVKPSDHGKADIADWSRPDLILCTPGFLYEGPQTDEGWDHWVQRLREVPGSNNAAVVGFTGVSAIDSDLYPVQQRLHAFINSVHDEVDENVLVHLVDGSLPWSVDGDANRVLINIANPTARDTFSWFLAQEWNHCENREPRVGLMFDVYEYWNEYKVNDQDSRLLIDRDRDGIPLVEDDDELIATREGRIEFLRSLRRHIADTSTDPNVGRYFLIGANTVNGRSDAEMLAELDFIMLEDIQCARGSGHEFEFFHDDDCGAGEIRYLPFHGAAAEEYVRRFCAHGYHANGLTRDGIVPYPADLSQAWGDLPAAMRHDAGGPFLAPEAQGSMGDDPDHPGHLEAFCLLFDDFFPIYHRMDSDNGWERQYWHPSEEALPDLHDLGPATSPLIRDSLGDHVHYWRRQYAAGSVEVVIADTSRFRCGDGDLFDYRVTVNGQVRRQSASWGPPAVETFFVAGWDSAGVGGTIRLDLTALASEPVIWERSYRLGDTGPWSDPAVANMRGDALAGHWDTSLPPRAGTLWVRVRGRDQTGLATDWAKREVHLTRFGGFGVVIADTMVHGTSYGLPGPDGDYEILGRGESVPDFAPPHVLEIHGTAPAGFVPVEVRWHNSLGGQGLAEGTVSWRVPAAPLHRGANVITITCIDAQGTARVGTITKEWDYPGKPGRR